MFEKLGNWWNNQKQQGDIARNRVMALSGLQNRNFQMQPRQEQGEMPIVSAFKQKSIKPITEQFTTQGFKKSIGNFGRVNPMDMVMMGTSAKTKALNGLKQQATDRMLRQQFQNEINSYSRQMAEQGRQNALRIAQEQAQKLQEARRAKFFQSVPQRYQPEQLITSYINKFK